MTRPTRRDAVLAAILAEADRIFDDHVRAFWTRCYLFAGEDGEVMLDDCDELLAEEAARHAETRATITGWVMEAVNEDGTRAGSGGPSGITARWAPR